MSATPLVLNGLPPAPDLAALVPMLTRLKLTAIRDQLDTLLAEAARRELTLAETLAFLCEREIARKDERRIEMALGLARFPMVRDLAGYDFAVQPAVDKAQVRELAAGRFVANGEAVLLLGPPGVGKTHCEIAGAPRRPRAAGAYWKAVAGGMSRRLTRRLLGRGRAFALDMSPVRGHHQRWAPAAGLIEARPRPASPRARDSSPSRREGDAR